MAERRYSKRLRMKEKSHRSDLLDSLSSSKQEKTAKRARSRSHEVPQTIIGRTSSSVSPENKEEPRRTEEYVSTHSDFYSLELANEMIRLSKFQEAISLIEQLEKPSERHYLMLSECYLQLGQMLNATRSIDSLHDFMVSQRVNLAIFMKLADEYIRTENYVRALVLLSCASKLYRENSDFKTAIEGIRICSSKLSIDIFPKLANGGASLLNIASNVGVEMINNMLAQMQSVPCADSDLEAKNEARCIYNIGRCYTGLENHEKSVEKYGKGISVMRQQYCVNAVKYQIYGDLLYNIGLAYKKLNNYVDAKRYLTDARKSYEKVENWQSVEAEQRYNEQVKKDLIEIESLLSTQ